MNDYEFSDDEAFRQRLNAEEPIQAEGETMTVTFDDTVNREGRCWAFSKEGKRCDLNGGHIVNHVTATEWSDEECYDPAQMVFVPVLDVPYLDEQPTMPPEAAQDGPGAPGPLCVVCDHPPHERDGCTGRGPMGQCDCRRYV